MLNVSVKNNISAGISSLLAINEVKKTNALKEVIEEFSNDVRDKEPMVPIDTGQLIDSEKKQVNNSNSASYGFTAPYAGLVHENIDAENWSRPGSGPRFISSKMEDRSLRDKYLKIMWKNLKFGN